MITTSLPAIMPKSKISDASVKGDTTRTWGQKIGSCFNTIKNSGISSKLNSWTNAANFTNDSAEFAQDPTLKNSVPVIIDAAGLIPGMSPIVAAANEAKIIYDIVECVKDNTDGNVAKECIVPAAIKTAENIPVVGAALGAAHTMVKFVGKAESAGCFEEPSIDKCLTKPFQQTLDDQPIYQAAKSLFQGSTNVCSL